MANHDARREQQAQQPQREPQIEQQPPAPPTLAQTQQVVTEPPPIQNPNVTFTVDHITHALHLLSARGLSSVDDYNDHADTGNDLPACLPKEIDGKRVIYGWQPITILMSPPSEIYRHWRPITKSAGVFANLPIAWNESGYLGNKVEVACVMDLGIWERHKKRIDDIVKMRHETSQAVDQTTLANQSKLGGVAVTQSAARPISKNALQDRLSSVSD